MTSREQTLIHFLTGRAIDAENPVHLGVEAVKAAPPVGTVALQFFGIAIADWVQLFMLVYAIGLCAQTAYRFRQWWNARKARSANRDS